MPRPLGLLLHLHDLGELLQEPRIDLRRLVHVVHAPAAVERLEDRPHAAIVRHGEPLAQRHGISGVALVPGGPEQPPRAAAELERPHRLHERFLERAADRHRLADRLHLRRQRAVGLGELLEVPSRVLDDDVVDGRLEGGGGQARDVVRDLVEVVAERQLGRDLRDREAGRLRRERRRARHARVHLDHEHPAVGRVHRELDVAAAGLDADAPDDAPGGIAHPLVLLVGERQRRRDGDAVARVDAHRVHVLDGADDDEVVRDVAHHLELVFLPPDDGLLDENLVDGAQAEAASGELTELFDVVGDAAADAAEGERRADDGGEPRALHDVERLGQGAREPALRRLDADFGHRVAEQQAIFTDLDRVDVRSDELDAMARQDSLRVQLHGEIERRLAADGGQHRVGLLPGDDRFDRLRRERLDVGAVGRLGVRHDGGRIAVHQHHLEPLAPERLAGLCARVVELRRLPDDDRAGADDENAVQIGASGHGKQARGYGLGKRPRRPATHCGHELRTTNYELLLSISSRNCRNR